MWNLKKLVRLVGVMGLLVRLVEEPAMDLAIGGVEGPVLDEKIHLGGFDQMKVGKIIQRHKVMSLQAHYLANSKDATAYQRVLLKLGTIHTTSQNGMDCQTHVWCRPMEETLLTNVIC